MEDKCIVCQTDKDIAPKIIKYETKTDKRFHNPILTSSFVILCEDCYLKYKNKQIEIVPH